MLHKDIIVVVQIIFTNMQLLVTSTLTNLVSRSRVLVSDLILGIYFLDHSCSPSLGASLMLLECHFFGYIHSPKRNDE